MITSKNRAISADFAWITLLSNILDQGEEQTPRGKKTLELIGHRSVFDMSQPIITVALRKLGYKFLVAEAWWIISGSNRVDEIAPYSKAIKNFSDDGLTFRGAYGPKIMDQIPWIAEQIKNDPNTRQGVLTIWRERPGSTRDYPCTVALQWMLRRGRDGKLYMHNNVTMRSSDAWLGWVYDVFNGSMETAFLIAYLREAYPEQFTETIHLGNLTLTAGSQHLYEEHFESAKNCVFEPESNLTYAPLNPAMYQGRPYDFLQHLKSLADRDGLMSPFGREYDAGQVPEQERGRPRWMGKLYHKIFDNGYMAELYSLGGSEKNTGFDAQPNPRGIKK